MPADFMYVVAFGLHLCFDHVYNMLFYFSSDYEFFIWIGLMEVNSFQAKIEILQCVSF